MIQVKLTIDKAAVLEEVARTTSYIGAKMAGDEGSYERILTTDQDAGMLQRFWDESKSEFCRLAKRLITAETDDGGAFTATLDLPGSFSEVLVPSIEDSLFSYFVNGVTGKWCVFTNKQEAGSYVKMAEAHMDDVMRKLLYKRKPVRPTYK
ncbi:MAG: hypothetical protein LUC33_04425 [Prevotellaceae bacterium]|nr:hypothetical protein [Prevotellaceae bacterium]